MRCASIVGTRPQFIKLAAVSRTLRERHTEIIIHTGQHYDDNMSAKFFAEFALPAPNYSLGCGSSTHGVQTGRMLAAIEQVLLREHVDWVIVYGDTNSTLAGALAAAKLHIPVAHVEAGLRSFNRAMPEEINRVVTDHLSDRLFCPTETARTNLQNEGIRHGVEVVGDVMHDLLLYVQPVLDMRTESVLKKLRLAPRAYVLVTIHRAANTDDPAVMRMIAAALNRLAIPVIFPVHPRTRECLQRYEISWSKHVQLIDPLGYLEMLALERAAYRILTDSGGVQKEAFLLQIPCVTLRDETEWPETVDLGWNVLVGSRQKAILEAIRLPRPQPARHNLFGMGDAAVRIVLGLESHAIQSKNGS